MRKGTSQAERERFRTALLKIIKESYGRPMTVRQIFYRAVVKKIVENTYLEYKRLQKTLSKMRRERELLFEAIIDEGRGIHQLSTFNSPAEAIRDAATYYRKSYWTDMPVFYNSIRQYSAFLETIGRVAPPYTVEAGIIGVKDWTLVISDQSGAQYLGEMYQGEVWVRKILSEMTDATMDSFLLTFFEKVYDQTGYPRPMGLYGFPGSRAHAR
jgi:hypothetical protein